jgi:hypothetical protein
MQGVRVQALPRQVLITAAVLSALAVTSACGGHDDQQTGASDSMEVSQSPQGPTTDTFSTASPSVSGSPSASPSTTASGHASASASASTPGSVAKETTGSASGTGAGSGDAAAAPVIPLTESGDRGSEHLINYPVQYAKALVINFNRWPATPGRGAGIFLHVNGSGATVGCVSVPRATMDRIMGWITPSAHPRIAIG